MSGTSDGSSGDKPTYTASILPPQSQMEPLRRGEVHALAEVSSKATERESDFKVSHFQPHLLAIIPRHQRKQTCHEKKTETLLKIT